MTVSPRSATALGAVGVAVAGLLAAAMLVRPDRAARAPASPVADLVAAVAESRPVEARLTGGFAYGAYVGPGRSAAGSSPSLAVLTAADGVRRRAAASSGEDALDAAAGVARLVVGDAAGAVAALGEVAERATASAAAHADLAAAYLARAGAGGAPGDLARALDAAERAVAAHPALVEGWFNRALALERLGPPHLARRAWRDYLDRDASSGWAGEARLRIASVDEATVPDWATMRRALEARPILPALARDAVARHAGRVREYIDDELLVAWAASLAAPGGVPCGECLEAAEVLAGELSAQRDDATMRDIVASVRRATAVGRGRQAADGLVAFARVRELFHEGGVDRADGPLRDAARLLASAFGAPEYLAFYGSFRDYYRGDVAAALPRLEDLAGRARRRGHLYVAARCYLIAATIAVRTTRFADALRMRQQAVEGFERAGDRAFAANALGLAAEDLEALGDLDGAWSLARRALAAVDTSARPRTHYLVLAVAGLLARSDGLHHAERAYAEEAERACAAAPDVALTAVTALDLALARDRAGDGSGAAAMLAAAEQRLARLPDPSMLPQFRTEFDDTQARLLSRSRPAAAVAAFTRVLEGLPASGSLYRVAETHLERGRAHRRLGQLDLAEADWRRGIELLEDERPGVRDEQLAVSHLAQAWDLFGELADLLVARGEALEGLRIVERGRARALLDSLAPGQSPRGADLDRVVSRFTGDVAALVYLTLPDRVVIWVVADGHVAHVVQRTSRPALEGDIRRWRDRIAAGEDAGGLDARLHEVLIAPVARFLPPRGALVVVPDGAIATVPFAALRSGDEVFAERYALGITPGLGLLRLDDGKPRARVTRVLAIGDPAVTPVWGARLPRLPDAVAEARAVAAQYPAGRVVTGTAATPVVLTDGLRTDDIVHYAGHAVANEAFPSRSVLLLAPDARGDGTLTPVGLAGLGPVRARLVVLSACSTAQGRVARGEGALSLARPFLAAGVPEVVATLWPTQDRASALLLGRFHERVARGVSAREALRDAQRWLRAQAGGAFDHPRHWAGFVCLGGGVRGT